MQKIGKLIFRAFSGHYSFLASKIICYPFRKLFKLYYESGYDVYYYNHIVESEIKHLCFRDIWAS